MPHADVSLTYKGTRIDLPELMRYILTHDVAAQYSPWFFTYHGDLTSERYLDRYVRFLRRLVAAHPDGVTGQKVLDAGCGFGIMDMLLAFMGAAEVHGLDAHHGMIETFRTYLGILPYALSVYPQQGTVAALPYAEDSFDIVLSHEAISHYLDVEAFFAEARRVLKPGGMLIISDSNNALCPEVVENTRAIWKVFEEGPPQTIHGHKVENPFLQQRALIIGREYPDLDPKVVAQLARHTSGLWGSSLKEAVEAYRRTLQLPDHVYREGDCPVDPVQGYFIENLFNPYELVGKLRALGLAAQVRAYLGGARGGAYALANDLLTLPPFTPLALHYARAFRIVAVKPNQNRAGPAHLPKAREK